MSKFKVVGYLAGIPPGNKNPEKPLILENFIKGVNAAGDTGVLHVGMTAVSCDVALVQGFVHEHGKDAPHLRLRKNVIDLQKKNNNRSLIVDSNLFLYRDSGNTRSYLRYSFDGVFPTTGFYFDTIVDPSRWKKISNDLNIELRPWRTNGNHILICLQRNGGWSMGGLSAIDWLNQTIQTIQAVSKRPIVVRTHPGDKKINSILKITQRNVVLSKNQSLLDDFRNCWCTITYNSSPGVASAIEGIPTFVTDKNAKNSQAFAVANTDLNLIENPATPDRQQWIERLSMSHWNFEELRSGEAWNHFKKFI
jgi:hypothetical protein